MEFTRRAPNLLHKEAKIDNEHWLEGEYVHEEHSQLFDSEHEKRQIVVDFYSFHEEGRHLEVERIQIRNVNKLSSILGVNQIKYQDFVALLEKG